MTAPGAVGPGRGELVLVADDDDDIRDLLAAQLRRWGYRVTTACDGEQALQRVRLETPELVLLDVGMPKVDGLTVIAQLRDSPVTALIPVLLLTALGRGSDVAAGLAAGADDYVKKPFQLLEVRARIQVALNRRRDNRALEELRSAIVPTQRPPDHDEFEVAVAYLPAAGAVAGGDLHAVVDAPGGHVMMIVGDVLGHGAAAAGLAAHTRALLTSHARHDSHPGRVLQLTNDALSEHAGPDDVTFVSAACLALHPASGTVTWALAGHPQPFLLPGNRSLPPAEPGPPLGVDVGSSYPTSRSRIAVGDTLLLVSDGLLEARRGDEQFADRELPALLAGAMPAGPQDLLDVLLDAYGTFAVDGGTDDVCLLALRTCPGWG